MLFISRELVAVMEEHARKEYPRECCGMLAGTGNVITKIFRTRNIAASLDEYELDPMQQVEAFEEIDRLSLKLLGVYHSHPNHPCYPSGLDIRRAFYPDTAFFILSLTDYHNPLVKAFTIREGKVMEEEIIIR